MFVFLKSYYTNAYWTHKEWKQTDFTNLKINKILKGSLGFVIAEEIKHPSIEYSVFSMAIKQLQNDTMDKDPNPSNL